MSVFSLFRRKKKDDRPTIISQTFSQPILQQGVGGQIDGQPSSSNVGLTAGEQDKIPPDDELNEIFEEFLVSC